MGLLRRAAIVVCGVAVALPAAPILAVAQVELPPARAPCSVLRGRPCHPSFCGVFHRGPCFPDYGAPFGEDMRLTIVSKDDGEPPNSNGSAGAVAADNADAEKTTDEHTITSVRAMFAALRSCWIPPPIAEARHGMEYTIRFAFKRDGAIVAPPFVTYSSHNAPAQVRAVYRDAVDAAPKRCAPLHFSDGMAEAVAGRPIAVRFVDNRTLTGAASPR